MGLESVTSPWSFRTISHGKRQTGAGSSIMKRLGLIVNPVAGMGGRVGLKGSDGVDILRMARYLGAVAESPRRAELALESIVRIKDQIEIITFPHEMGEDEARASGFSPRVIGSILRGKTTPEDTRKAAKEMALREVDLILFAGGDGTARDIFTAIEQHVPVLGIPAGVKIHSAVYAVTPRQAGEAAYMFLTGQLMRMREAEVMDIDEEAFRQGIVSARLYGYLRVPEERRLLQSVKSGGVQAEQEALSGMAADVVNDMAQGCIYVIGPGTTTRAIMDELGLEHTLLGVDVVLDRRLVAKDANAAQLASLVSGMDARIVVTAIGGQGFIFGRGNQQISPAVIKNVGKENILVVATRDKLISLGGRPLLVDTGERELDEMLSGYVRVTTGFNEYHMYKIEA